MKNGIIGKRLLLLTSLLWLPAVALAGAWVDSYWPLNHGDHKVLTFSGGEMTLDVWNQYGNVYRISSEALGESEYELHEKTATGVYLLEVGVGDWMDITFNPRVMLFDDAMLEHGGSRTTSTTVSYSWLDLPSTITVKVTKAGTVTVPAGIFTDCRSVTVTMKTTVPGEGTFSETLATAVLAPRAGLIKSRVDESKWASLVSGTVGGVDVRKLAGVQTDTIEVQVSGSGKLSPDYTGKSLTIGKNYTLTATPAKGYIFSHWEGTVSGSTAKLTFTMAEDMVVRAVFVPNPFIPVKGSYSGLMTETDGTVQQRSAGLAAVTVTEKGSYSGSLTLAGKRYALSGSFDATGNATKSIKVSSTSALTVTLALNLATPDDRLTGTVTSDTWTALIDANRAGYDGKTMIATEAGKYTLIIPGTAEAAVQPGGDSYGTVTVDKAGKIKFAGVLADGTKVTQSATLSGSGEWPLYVSLSKGQGVLMSWLTFASTATEDLAGQGGWIKPATITKDYPAGFAIDIALSGCRYTVPPTGSNPLGLPEATALFERGNLAEPITKDLVLDANGKAVNLSTKEFTLKMVRSSGLISGKVMVPAWNKSIPFNGVVLQKQQAARGYFLGTDQSGSVWIGH